METIHNSDQPMQDVTLEQARVRSQRFRSVDGPFYTMSDTSKVAQAGVDVPADSLRDGLLAAGETEDSLLADLRERRENESADIPGTVQEEIAALMGKSDKDIDFSDIPTTTDVDWDGAVRGKFYRGDAVS